jgi:hypothetical protein
MLWYFEAGERFFGGLNSMNKLEVSEIKKIFDHGNGYFTLNKLCVAIISETEIKHSFTKSGALLEAREVDMYYKILKAVINKKVGRNLIQYDFPKEAYGLGHAQNVLYNVNSSKFNTDVDTEAFLDMIVNNYTVEAPYAVVSAQCTYNVRRKGEVLDDADNEYNFLVTAICPVVQVDSGFSYNNITGEFSTEGDPKLYIQQKPTDGFIFPTFDNREPNINSVMYYCKKSAEADVAIVEDVLECNFKCSADQEKDYFNYILQSTFGDKVNYQFMYALNEKLTEIAENHKGDTRLYTVDEDKLSDILSGLGADEAEISTFGTVYQKIYGDNIFTLNNLIESNIKLKTSEYTISFSKAVGDLVSTTVIDGARAIRLKTTDSKMEVNEAEVNI